MLRRDFVMGSLTLAGATLLPRFARAEPAPAKVPVAFTFDMTPPLATRDAFVEWGVKNRGEDAKFLAQRWNRLQALIANKDVWDDKDKIAFALNPREEFCRPVNKPHAYESAFLDIGYGVTISGPHAVARMTSAIDVKRGDKVLEIGTGSGYQSSYLSRMTDKVFTIEIIKPLAERTRGVYDDLIARGYTELKNISTKQADGYYGWEEKGPFDKIIVTCGIDHIPPPLLQQLKAGGIMVIPIGPPGRQHVLEVKKVVDAAGNMTVTRRDIYNGKIVNFVPFTKAGGGTW